MLLATGRGGSMAVCRRSLAASLAVTGQNSSLMILN